MQGLISIIIPTYNRSSLLGSTLDSILAQTYQNWECIVIDDGSEDYSKELMGFYLRKDPRIQYIPRPKHFKKGANTCRNFGFVKSKGEFINWFDSDDIMLPHFIEVQMAAFTEEVEMALCSGYYTNEFLNNRKPIVLQKEMNLFKEFVLWNQHIITNSVLFRKSFLIGKKLFHPNITRGQEAEFYSRLFYELPENKYIINTDPLFLYRQHPESKTTENKIYNKKNKESEAFIFIENLKRSKEIKENELFIFLYKRLVYLFFRSLENKHAENSKYILNNLILIFWSTHNKFFSLEILFCGKLLSFLNQGSYRIERRWRMYKIKL